MLIQGFDFYILNLNALSYAHFRPLHIINPLKYYDPNGHEEEEPSEMADGVPDGGGSSGRLQGGGSDSPSKSITNAENGSKSVEKSAEKVAEAATKSDAAINASKLQEEQTKVKLESNQKQKISEQISQLHQKLKELAEKYLLPKYRKIDPNLKAGYTGSFKTGTVGNPNKSTYGQAIDLNNYDIDYYIKSDILNSRYGNSLKADKEFRAILSNTSGFEGLKPNKQGFSIKFKPLGN